MQTPPNSNTPTLLLHPRYDEDSQLLWQAAIARGWNIVRTDSVSTPIPNPVIYGGYMWGERIAGQLGTGSGLRLMAPPDDWLVHAPHKVTERTTTQMRAGEIARFPRFVKSLRGKTIPSRVYYSTDLPPGCANDEVLVQEPVVWAREYRAFVLGREVRALSQYADHGELRIEPWESDTSDCGTAAAYLTSALRGLELPYACVVDVGELEDADWFDRWAVVEPNPAWCSGIYACEPDRVLEVVAASCGVRV